MRKILLAIKNEVISTMERTESNTISMFLGRQLRDNEKEYFKENGLDTRPGAFGYVEFTRIVQKS